MEDYAWDWLFAFILVVVGAFVFNLYSANDASQEFVEDIDSYFQKDIALVDFLRVGVDGKKVEELGIVDERLKKMDMADVIILWPKYKDKNISKDGWFGLMQDDIIGKFLEGNKGLFEGVFEGKYMLEVSYPDDKEFFSNLEEEMEFAGADFLDYLYSDFEIKQDGVYLPYPGGKGKIKVVLSTW